jgi:hypothetical protein
MLHEPEKVFPTKVKQILMSQSDFSLPAYPARVRYIINSVTNHELCYPLLILMSRSNFSLPAYPARVRR